MSARLLLFASSVFFFACTPSALEADLHGSDGAYRSVEQALGAAPDGLDIWAEASFRGFEHPVNLGGSDRNETTVVWLDTAADTWVSPLGTGRLHIVAETADGWTWTSAPVDGIDVIGGVLTPWNDGESWTLASSRIGLVATAIESSHVNLLAECDGGPCGDHSGGAQISLPDGQFPEGIVSDGETWFVGSMTGGDITAIGADGGRWSVQDEEDGRVGLGLALDADAGLLWSCSITEDGYLGEVRAYDVASNAVVQRYDLTELTPEGSCNDVVVDGSGAVFVTDRENPHVYRIAEGQASVFATADLLDSWGVGTNGIALHPGGEGLYVTNYLPARLMFVPFDDPNAVVEVDVQGASISDGLTGGADGIVWFEDALYVAMPGKLVRFVPEGRDPTRGWAWSLELAGGVSDVAVHDDLLFVSNGQPADYLLGFTTPDPFEVAPIGWSGWRAPIR